MSRIWKVCGIALLALGLFVPACKKKGGDSGDEAKKEKKEKSEAEEPKEEEKKAEKEAEEEDAGSEMSQTDYVDAAVELACVDMKLKGDDVDSKKIKEEILGKYGFDKETYAKAEKEFAEAEEVKKEIDSSLEECTEEKAKKFAGMADGEEGEKEEKKAAPKPARTGTMKAKVGGTGGFKNAELRLTVTEDFSSHGAFKGKREGKGFRVSLEGEVTKDNKLSLSGSEGKNNVDVKGTLSGDGANVTVSGSVWDRKFSVAMEPK